jgi:hypothetical protein
VVKEDVVFIKDGAVAQFDSVKEYLDSFRIHLEQVRLKRLVKDEKDLVLDLEFLEAKLKFLIFMSQKKRANSEIIDFLKQFTGWISQKLSKIEIIKLSSDHIKETEEMIKMIKNKIKEVRAQIKKQEVVVKKIIADSKKSRSASLLPSTSKPIANVDPDIEVFEIDGDAEED